jgi:hypothetical protein
MTTPQNEYKLAEYQKLIAEQKESGLYIKEFCKQKHISIGKWHYYRNALKKSQDLKSPKFSPVKVINKTAHESSDIKLALPNGFHLALPLNIDPYRVKQLVEVLLSC